MTTSPGSPVAFPPADTIQALTARDAVDRLNALAGQMDERAFLLDGGMVAVPASGWGRLLEALAALYGMAP